MTVDVRGVSKYFGSVPAVVRASFRIADGEWVALCGPSGSGKTTLLRLIAGFETPDEGSIALQGAVVSEKNRLCPPHQRQLAVVFQQPTLWPHMTVRQHLEFAARTRGAETDERLRAVLDAVGLAELAHRYPAELSGGQARRVGLARALAAEPRLLLMDEPYTNLDADAKAELMAVTRREVARLGSTVLYVTHDLEEIDGVANRILHIAGGQLIEQQESASVCVP